MVLTGFSTSRAATRPQGRRRASRGTVFDGQNTARPKMASSAGSSVRPASSITAIADGERQPRSW